MLYLTKDTKLSIPLLQGLLKFWPFANSIKEILFISEVQEVIEVCVCIPDDFKPMVPRVFKKVAQCLSSDNLQTTDRMMWLFDNKMFLRIIEVNKEVAFPLLVPLVHKLSKKHWQQNIQESMESIDYILQQIDNTEYDKCKTIVFDDFVKDN